MKSTALFKSFAAASLLLFAAGCATGPDIRTHTADNVDFEQYETFGWAPELGTDRGGYSTMTTNHFKDSIRDEMEALGYRYVENDPDLLVNFFTTMRDRTETYTTVEPVMTLGTGYYGYRYGLYTAWPYYREEVNTFHYQVGTANVDVVDAERMQLIWEGVLEGRLTEESVANPGPAIDSAIEELFTRFPTRTDRE